MRTIKRKAKFGSKPDQMFYHERFENYKEFRDAIMARQDGAHKTIESVMSNGGSDWVGCKSVKEAEDMLMNGWAKKVEDMKIAFKKELATLDNSRLRTTVASVSGFMPIVPNALLGLPNSMIDVRMTPKKSRILNFMVSIDRSCGNSVDEIVRKMTKIFAYMAMLERSGQYRCRIEVFFTAFGGHGRDRTNTSVSVLVKSENQLFDIKRLCFPIIHPAMLRLFAFAWEESLPMPADQYMEGGYGTSFEHWDEEYKRDYIGAVGEEGQKTICIDLHSDIEEIIGKEVR